MWYHLTDTWNLVMNVQVGEKKLNPDGPSIPELPLNVFQTLSTFQILYLYGL